jgi:hypothetical protein
LQFLSAFGRMGFAGRLGRQENRCCCFHSMELRNVMHRLRLSKIGILFRILSARQASSVHRVVGRFVITVGNWPLERFRLDGNCAHICLCNLGIRSLWFHIWDASGWAILVQGRDQGRLASAIALLAAPVYQRYTKASVFKGRTRISRTCHSYDAYLADLTGAVVTCGASRWLLQTRRYL